jgi:type III restriction enzyme
MITVANRTETAARVKYAFDHGKVRIDELADPARTLHIDSKVLDKAEAREEEATLARGALAGEEEDEESPARKLTKEEQAERLRVMVDTVGVEGQPGEPIQNVISVGMLSEGWDAKTVTHIMGLRAFSSQLLCEQVVGRGLRRTSYEIDRDTGLLAAEYVNIFGVPFTFLPHEGGDDVLPPPPTPKSKIEPDPQKQAFELTWPNVVRIEHVYAPQLTLELGKVEVLRINAAETATLAELAPVVEGKPDVTRLTEIQIEDLARRFRFQKIVFETARDVYDQMRPDWKGGREDLLAQLVRIVESFLRSERLEIVPALFNQEDRRRRILLTLNMNKVVRHLWQAIRFENALRRVPVFDAEKPIRGTGDMLPWYTGRPWEYTKKSHINRSVFDSTWEASEASVLDRDERVLAWAKNDHLGFEIVYVFDGQVKKYRPDYLVRMADGSMLVLEVKGQESAQDEAKRRFMDEWVCAVNDHGGFGKWAWAVSRNPSDVHDLVAGRLMGK